MSDPTSVRGPHQGAPVFHAGEPLESAKAALIMLHGRGATAQDILALAPELHRPGVACLAPQAAGHTWYPYTFLAPLEANEPWLSSALAVIRDVLAEVAAAAIPPERTFLLGFSQGACLTLEFTARHARRYGGVIAFTGGLIGPDGTPRDYPGSLDRTPVFIGSSDPDPHVPVARVHESVAVLRRMGAQVTARLYPGMGHTINDDELDVARGLLAAVVDESSGLSA